MDRFEFRFTQQDAAAAVRDHMTRLGRRLDLASAFGHPDLGDARKQFVMSALGWRWDTVTEHWLPAWFPEWSDG
jgi:hypothetical protein